MNQIALPEHLPFWPDKDSCRMPCLEPLPLVDPRSFWIKRVVDAFFRRTQYLFTKDYFTYCPSLDQWIFIPQNFVYDMASVPLILAFLFRPSGLWAYTAGPHDCGYRVGGLFLSPKPGVPYRFVPLDRLDLDRVFENLANKSNNLRRVNRVGYRMLRIFGRFNWKPRPIQSVNWLQPVMP